jgi:VanZ family protein
VKRFLRRWGPALLWTALLFAVSSRSSLPVDLHSGSDKLAHFAAYAVLGVLLAFGQVRSGMRVLWPVVLGSLIGALDELFQSTVPGRSAEVGDWVADSLGAAFGVLLFHLWSRPGTPRGEPARSSHPVLHE